MVAKRLDGVAVDAVADPTLASLLLAKQRELRLQLEMLVLPGLATTSSPLSIELYGAVSPALLGEAEAILDDVPHRGPTEAAVARRRRPSPPRAQAELDHYRALAPGHRVARRGARGQHRRDGLERRPAHRARRRGSPRRGSTRCSSTRSAPTSSPT